MRVMAKYAPLAVLLLCACSAQASDKIPISAVPKRVRAAIEYYAPGAQLTEARVTQDSTYRKIYNCTYFRNIHLGSIKLGSRGQLLDIDGPLAIGEFPPRYEERSSPKRKGGSLRKSNSTLSTAGKLQG